MTITAPTEPFRNALAKLQAITSTKTSLSVLGAVTLDCGFNGLELSATNIDQWFKVTVAGADADQETVPFSVSSKDLYDTLRYVDEEECTLKVTDQTCIVTAGRNEAKLPLITDPLPLLPKAEWGKPFTVDNLPELLSKCLPHASKEAHRYILNGVYFSPAGLVATNGRYSLVKIEADIKGEANVPAAAAALIAKEKGPVSCRFSPQLAEFSGEGWSLTTKLIESADGSKYPSFKEGFDKVSHRMSVERTEAIRAAMFAALPLAPEIDVVAAEHTSTELRFSSPSNCPNPKSKVITAKADKAHSWAVSARKLAATLNVFDCELVDIGFTDMQSIIITDGPITAVLFLCRI